MPHLALMMLQVASATTAPPPPPTAVSGTATASLLHPVPPGRCSGKADEIVVCGKDANSYRLPQASQQFDVAGPPKAEWKLFGNATGGIGTSQRVVGGYPSNAVMATIKIPF